MQTSGSQSPLLWESLEEVVRYEQSIENGLKRRKRALQTREAVTNIVRGCGKLASKFSGSNQSGLLVVMKMLERATKGIWIESKGYINQCYYLECFRD